jgi:hypothetical protein
MSYMRGTRCSHVWSCSALAETGEPYVGIVIPKEAYNNEVEPEDQPENLDILYLRLDTAKEFLQSFTGSLEKSIENSWNEEEGDEE